MEDSYESYEGNDALRGKYINRLVEKYDYMFKDSGMPRRSQELVAVLCENQRRREAVHEDSSTANLPLSVFPTKFAFPLINQVFPELLATKLAQVYPMTGPIGRVYYKHYTDNAANSLTHSGSYASNVELGTVKTGRMVLASTDITAQKWILQAAYSTELAEDAQAMGNINVEQDLLAALAQEILGEIDWVVLSDMLANASQNVTYSSAISSGETNLDARNRLYQSIVDADVLVQLRRFHQTNYIVGHPSAVAKLRKLDSFALTNGAAATDFAMGVRHFGDFAGQWEVYAAPQFPNTTQLLLGTKGVGYIYAPYVPLELMPQYYDPTVDQWLRNIRTRAARKCTIPDEFVTVTLS